MCEIAIDVIFLQFAPRRNQYEMNPLLTTLSHVSTTIHRKQLQWQCAIFCYSLINNSIRYLDKIISNFPATYAIVDLSRNLENWQANYQTL